MRHTPLLLCSVFALTGCEAPDAPDASQVGPEAKRLDATEDHHWLYDGMMPPLRDWQVVVSLAGHTARVTGALPQGWRRPLPTYAVPFEAPDGRPMVHVVYPIATAMLTDPNGAPTGNQNADPGDYPRLTGWAYTPSNVAGRGIPWGGFPYLEFDPRRAIAFHGPITAQDGAWRLLRGPVSHACARMQGEHIVELAHLMGVDVSAPVDADTSATFHAPRGQALVEVIDDFDRLDGRVLDVDYPATGWRRPTGEDVWVFPTWSSDDHPRFVCPAAEAPGCGHMPAGLASPVAPDLLGELGCPDGYQAWFVGAEGGRLCTDGRTALGPFTQVMRERCRTWGGGGACASDTWSLGLATGARGEGVCPSGAALDHHHTLYCVERGEALGPFPARLRRRCEQSGGEALCAEDRWPTRALAEWAGGVEP